MIKRAQLTKKNVKKARQCIINRVPGLERIVNDRSDPSGDINRILAKI